eukprot:CAMPEP_0117653840 /NCGR_PEP_ID=MMETSP0804-20121206/3415_1 /TAXON_ID=1074897 /ORGANISM="Tetraselmis astigmatica, Strain CCMP880" /LENGTH=50 /DNA_ID=CAMNT_0005460061 /DNA_START=747 /DNA_END=899 /DNA_ORIENTATION=+
MSPSAAEEGRGEMGFQKGGSCLGGAAKAGSPTERTEGNGEGEKGRRAEGG